MALMSKGQEVSLLDLDSLHIENLRECAKNLKKENRHEGWSTR